jgi:ABC-type lipoprotein export system ATPase subunit
VKELLEVVEMQEFANVKAKHLSGGQQQRIAQLIAAQERSLQVFADFVDPALRVRWKSKSSRVKAIQISP